jgi:hypothetical protein
MCKPRWSLHVRIRHLQCTSRLHRAKAWAYVQADGLCQLGWLGFGGSDSRMRLSATLWILAVVGLEAQQRSDAAGATAASFKGRTGTRVSEHSERPNVPLGDLVQKVVEHVPCLVVWSAGDRAQLAHRFRPCLPNVACFGFTRCVPGSALGAVRG